MAVSNSKIKVRNASIAGEDQLAIPNPQSEIRNPKTWSSIDFDRIDYQEAWDLQINLITARKSRILQNDIVLFLEHPPVLTLGRRGGRRAL